MSLYALPSGAVARSASGQVFALPVGTTDIVPSVGPVRVVDGAFKVAVALPQPPEGHAWRLALPTEPPVAPAETTAEQEVTIGQLTVVRGDLEAWWLNLATGLPTRAIEIPLAWPPEAVIPDPPTIVAAIGDVSAGIGDTVTVAGGAAFSGATGYSARLVPDAPLPPGWSFNVATGALGVPTSGPVDAAVRITAANAGGSAALTFGVVVALTPMVNTVPPQFTGADTDIGTVWTATGGSWSGGHAPFTTEFGFEVDGALGVYSETATRAILASDPGHTVTVTIRRTDAFGQVAELRATGAAVVPGLGTAVPDVVGAIANVDVRQGATVVRTAAGVFSAPGATLEYSMRFKALGALTPGWGIDPVDGSISIPTDALITSRNVVVRAANVVTGIGAEVEFNVKVRAAMSYAADPVFGPLNPPGLAVGAQWRVPPPPVLNGVAPFTHLTEYFREGVSIGGFVAEAYTLGAPDLGREVTARHRTIDAEGQIVTARATGSVRLPAVSPPVLITQFPDVISALEGTTAIVQVSSFVGGTGPFKYVRTGAAASTTLGLDSGEFRFNAPEPAPAGPAAGVEITVTGPGGVLTIPTSVLSTSLVVDPPVEPPLPNPNVVVGNQQQLDNAMNAVPANMAGTYVIGLTDGLYGAFVKNNYQRPGRVALMAMGRAVIFRSISMTGARRVTLRGINIIGDTTDAFGFPAQGTRALNIAGTVGFRLFDVLIDYFFDAMVASGVSDFRIDWTTIRRCVNDGIRLYDRCSIVTVSHLWSKDPVPDIRRSEQHGYSQTNQVQRLDGTWETHTADGKQGRHPDTAAQLNEPCTDINFEDCLVTTDNCYAQGFLVNNKSSRIGTQTLDGPNAHNGIRFKRCQIVIAHTVAIKFELARNIEVRDLLVRQIPGANWGIRSAPRAWPKAILPNMVRNPPAWTDPANLADAPGKAEPEIVLQDDASGVFDNLVLPVVGGGIVYFAPNPATRPSAMPPSVAAKVQRTRIVRSNTAVPDGWAATDVARGRVGQYGYLN